MVGGTRCHSISAIGAKHAETGKLCQDSAGHFSSEKYSAIAVSDGHGGSRHFRSGQGAKIAVAVALDCIKECFAVKVFAQTFTAGKSTDADKEKRIMQLKESIIWRWNDAVCRDIEEHPFEEEELSGLDADVSMEMRNQNSDSSVKAYGATLLVAVIGDGFWFGVQIGDGTFVVKKDGEYHQPIPLDELCVGPLTTSLCGSDAIAHFHHIWGKGMPEAIFIASDGVDESFASIGALYEFYNSVIKNGVEDWSGNTVELEAYLPQMSEKGSKDDVSLAWLVSESRKGADSAENVSDKENIQVVN